MREKKNSLLMLALIKIKSKFLLYIAVQKEKKNKVIQNYIYIFFFGKDEILNTYKN